MFVKKLLIGAIFLITLIGPTVVHAADFMSVSKVSKLSQSGEVLLVDIRRPSEWKKTGVAKHAFKISMHQKGFFDKIKKQTNGNKNNPVALICAHGNRSTWAAKELEKRGYTNVINVKEGMLGSAKGPGWLAKGLPLRF